MINFPVRNRTMSVSKIDQDFTMELRYCHGANFRENLLEAASVQDTLGDQNDVISFVRPTQKLGLNFHRIFKQGPCSQSGRLDQRCDGGGLEIRSFGSGHKLPSCAYCRHRPAELERDRLAHKHPAIAASE
jgi:hypothetical protein